MAKVYFKQNIADEYLNLYKSCEAKAEHFSEIDRLVEKIIDNRTRYEAVAQSTGVPWYLIAVIHNMESSQNFSRHLHNGDSLNARTKHVPKDRPRSGQPPFTWEESAIDALKLRRLHHIDEWSVSRILYELEGYNGWGYRIYHTHVLSPYLWSYSNHYISGKYIADGTWSDTAKSKQCGAALLIKRLEEVNEISLLSVDEPIFFYSNTFEKDAEKLQQFLNQFNGIALRVDGWPGKKTSDAMYKLFGLYLKGDSRDE